ncbi:ankyrin repeat domain-containing protein [Henriciella sp.]|uniref:ankyrin repeat domain-containing protein n=1 Tax=Henriciella sp. TaxID=1968823 RepID=UPI002628905A|nr:ankyrin repeat domain-containing protein [Henriciella sp.]
MIDDSRERLRQLEVYLKSLSENERRDLGTAAYQSERGIFDLVTSGDAAGLHVALKRDPTLAERQDENGMTPLHWSAIDKSGLLFEVLTQEANSAPWTRDKAGRLPLDVMREAGRRGVADKAERLTYPQLFLDERDGPVGAKKLAAFKEKYEAVRRPDTRPNHARHLEPLVKTQARRTDGKERDDRER